MLQPFAVALVDMRTCLQREAPEEGGRGLSGAAYLAALWALGALDRSEVLGLRELLQRRPAARAAEPSAGADLR